MQKGSKVTHEKRTGKMLLEILGIGLEKRRLKN